MNKEFFNTSEVADYLGRSPGAIRNLVMRRVIPYRKLAGRLIFLKAEIEVWIRSSPGLRLSELKN